jgi:hypothetical protein
MHQLKSAEEFVELDANTFFWSFPGRRERRQAHRHLT